jgi:hypothetical protein
MMNSLCIKVGGMGFFGGVKTPEAARFAIDPKLSDVLAPFFAKLNAHEACGIVSVRSMRVLRIELNRNVAQVVPSVIGSVAVDVVHVMARMLSGHVKPCQAGGSVGPAINVNVDVSRSAVKRPSNIADSGASAVVGAARKNAGFLVVVEQFAQAFCRKLMCAHKVKPSSGKS